MDNVNKTPEQRPISEDVLELMRQKLSDLEVQKANLKEVVEHREEQLLNLFSYIQSQPEKK